MITGQPFSPRIVVHFENLLTEKLFPCNADKLRRVIANPKASNVVRFAALSLLDSAMDDFASRNEAIDTQFAVDDCISPHAHPELQRLGWRVYCQAERALFDFAQAA